MKKRILLIDTETAARERNAPPQSGLVYDLSFVVTDKKGRIHDEFTALVKETYTDAPLMMGAHYAKKHFTHYAPMLDNREIRLMPWLDIVEHVRYTVCAFEINTVCAYNLDFDSRVIANTHALHGDGAPVMPHPVKRLCLGQFAARVLMGRPTYREQARALDWVTDAGNIRTGAEYCYRYLTRDPGFVEDHTGLSDCRIEARILAECYRQKKRVPYNVPSGAFWKLAQ
jgi:hypothetical protein